MNQDTEQMRIPRVSYLGFCLPEGSGMPQREMINFRFAEMPIELFTLDTFQPNSFPRV